MTDVDYTELLCAWGLEYAGQDVSAHIEGSPERSAARAVVRDRSGGRWIMDAICADNLARKRRVAETLEVLSGLDPVSPYRRTEAGDFFHMHESQSWMLRAYIPGVALDRRAWLDAGWRIDAMQEFLVQLRAQSSGLRGDVFSVADYVTGRMHAWRAKVPTLAARLDAPFRTLNDKVFPVLASLPVAFCHGDYHPLNVVWGDRTIQSVIDWEFCGLKPELYDVALLLGCMGFDEPDHLIGAPAVRLVQTLRSTGFGVPASWDQLIGLIAAVRFGWMSEWVRRGDEDSAELEVFYIQLLLDQADVIVDRWALPVERSA